MLYADAQKPQVMIKVNGIDGVCPSFNCDYLYTSTSAVVTGQSLSGSTLTITGTGLPTADVKVKFSNAECIVQSGTNVQITCTLSISPAAGSWDVRVTDLSGLIPVDAAVAKIDIALVVTSVSKTTDLNQLGGDTLTLSGTGFETSLDSTTVTFSDGTSCTTTSTSSLELVCVVDGFDSATLDPSTPLTMTATVNSVTDASQTVSILPTKQSGVSVTPTSVSPVLASVITVTLEASYPHTLVVSDFKAHLVLATDKTVTRPLYIKSVDDATKSL